MALVGRGGELGSGFFIGLLSDFPYLLTSVSEQSDTRMLRPIAYLVGESIGEGKGAVVGLLLRHNRH